MALQPIRIQHKYLKSYVLSRILLANLLFLILFLSGCQPIGPQKSTEQTGNLPSTYISKSDFLLDTLVSITIYDKKDTQLLDEAISLIRYYEGIFSRTDPDAEVYSVNHGLAPHEKFTFTVSEELFRLIRIGRYYGQLSNGAFDITMAPVTELWHFTTNTPVVPEEETISNALSLVDYESLYLEGIEENSSYPLDSPLSLKVPEGERKITFAKRGMALDLGGIAKGYIADRVKDFLMAKGVQSALINLGGNILCIGNKPDGSPFRIGIQKPFADSNETAAIIEITDQSVVSSGIYERYFLWEGKQYHHILDPLTGYPVDNNLTSVTIVSKYSVDGDGLSTTCFSLGLEAGGKLVESLPDTYAMFQTSDGKIYYTKGFLETIKLINP